MDAILGFETRGHLFVGYLFGDGGGGGGGIFGEVELEGFDGEFEGVFVREVFGGVVFGGEGFIFFVFGFGLFLFLLVLFLFELIVGEFIIEKTRLF